MEYNLQILNKKKEKLKEKKEKYDIDLNLYKKFKQLKLENNSFVIPDLFTEKYIIMEELSEKNCLNIDNFYKNYTPNNSSSFNSLFSGDGKQRDLLEITTTEDEDVDEDEDKKNNVEKKSIESTNDDNTKHIEL